MAPPIPRSMTSPSTSGHQRMSLNEGRTFPAPVEGEEELVDGDGEEEEPLPPPESTPALFMFGSLLSVAARCSSRGAGTAVAAATEDMADGQTTITEVLVVGWSRGLTKHCPGVDGCYTDARLPGR
jgi:hypothetical protein